MSHLQWGSEKEQEGSIPQTGRILNTRVEGTFLYMEQDWPHSSCQGQTSPEPMSPVRGTPNDSM